MAGRAVGERIIARLVPWAACCDISKTSTSTGMMTAPPPRPITPEKIPTNAPKAMRTRGWFTVALSPSCEVSRLAAGDADRDGRLGRCVGHVRLQERGTVAAAAALVVAPEGLRGRVAVVTELVRKVREEQLEEGGQRDAVRLTEPRVEPVGELEE